MTSPTSSSGSSDPIYDQLQSIQDKAYKAIEIDQQKKNQAPEKLMGRWVNDNKVKDRYILVGGSREGSGIYGNLQEVVNKMNKIVGEKIFSFTTQQGVSGVSIDVISVNRTLFQAANLRINEQQNIDKMKDKMKKDLIDKQQDNQSDIPPPLPKTPMPKLPQQFQKSKINSPSQTPNTQVQGDQTKNISKPAPLKAPPPPPTRKPPPPPKDKLPPPPKEQTNVKSPSLSSITSPPPPSITLSKSGPSNIPPPRPPPKPVISSSSSSSRADGGFERGSIIRGKVPLEKVIMKNQNEVREIFTNKIFNQLDVQNVPGDGNCQLHGIRRQLILKQDRDIGIAELRKMAMNYIKKHYYTPEKTKEGKELQENIQLMIDADMSEKDKKFDPNNKIYKATGLKPPDITAEDRSKFLAKLEDSGEFCSNLQLFALSNILKMPINIYQENEPPIPFGSEFNSDISINLIRVGRNHYMHVLGYKE